MACSSQLACLLSEKKSSLSCLLTVPQNLEALLEIFWSKCGVDGVQGVA